MNYSERKIGKNILEVIIIISLLCFSCTEDKIVNPSNDASKSKLKSIKYYGSLESDKLIKMDEFEYDDQFYRKTLYGSTKDTSLGYELYYYDSEKNITKMESFTRWDEILNKYILYYTKAFTYQDSLIKTEVLKSNIFNTVITIDYKYSEGQLTKKTEYYNDEVKSYSIYKYKDSKLFKEYIYYENELHDSLEYKYDFDLLTEIDFYQLDGIVYKQIIYSYDQLNRVTIEETKHFWGWTTNDPNVILVIRYEYY